MKEIITTLEKRADFLQLLQSQADTILVALDGLSSTAAEKLSKEELCDVAAQIADYNAKAVKSEHFNKKKLAIRANMTFHEGMLSTVEEMLAFLKEIPVDGLYFSDPAIYYLAKKYDLVDRLVYDPETLMTSINDGQWWLDHGVQSICISPLLTLEETVEILSALHRAIVTVHGRTLMSRSYRKLLTSYQEIYEKDVDLSHNKEVTLIEMKREGTMPVYEDETGTLIYSDNVLDSFDFIEKVLASDPSGLLIEGSYLPIEEQLAAVQAYRQILDGEDPTIIGKEYREQFHGEPLDSGYYEQKTVR